MNKTKLVLLLFTMSGLVTEAKKGLIRGFCLKIERLKKFMDVRNLPCFIYKMREILDAILEGENIFLFALLACLIKAKSSVMSRTITKL